MKILLYILLTIVLYEFYGCKYNTTYADQSNKAYVDTELEIDQTKFKKWVANYIMALPTHEVIEVTIKIQNLQFQPFLSIYSWTNFTTSF